MQKRCDRNRKRSKRRSIHCSVHHCHLHSVSQKHPLYADCAEQLQQRGVARRNALLAVASRTTILLTGEWLEAFWCDECQSRNWYHVQRLGNNHYEAAIAPPELWLHATGVIHPNGNPSVGEFTRRSAKKNDYQAIKEFHFMR